MAIHPDIRAEHLESAAELIELLEDEDLIQAVAGLIELSKCAGGERGFKIVVDEDHAALECRKYSGDTYLEGLSVEALSGIVKVIGRGN